MSGPVLVQQLGKMTMLVPPTVPRLLLDEVLEEAVAAHVGTSRSTLSPPCFAPLIFAHSISPALSPPVMLLLERLCS